MFWRFCRTKPFIDSYSTSRDRQSNASPLFFGTPLTYFGKYAEKSKKIENQNCRYVNIRVTEPGNRKKGSRRPKGRARAGFWG